jgi:hypothetical protein
VTKLEKFWLVEPDAPQFISEATVTTLVEVVVAVLITVVTLPVLIVFVTVDSKDPYDSTLADTTTAAMTIAIARRVRLRYGATLIPAEPL